MNKNIFLEIENYYHGQTLTPQWSKDCGNGNKKLDEIQIFLLYLKNKKSKIKKFDKFIKNLKYKEKEVDEPGDLEYLNKIYQITHGNSLLYGKFMANKNKQGTQILPATDIISEQSLVAGFKKKLEEKEKLAKKNIILLIKIDRRNFYEMTYIPNIKVKTLWKDIILVFNDINLSIKL